MSRQELERGDGASRSVMEGASSRAAGRKELEGTRLARQDRGREAGRSSRARGRDGRKELRCKRKAGGSSRGRPAGGRDGRKELERLEERRRCSREVRREL
jgi:hypothetical protein